MGKFWIPFLFLKNFYFLTFFYFVLEIHLESWSLTMVILKILVPNVDEVKNLNSAVYQTCYLQLEYRGY